jgi:hypothetical protein
MRFVINIQEVYTMIQKIELIRTLHLGAALYSIIKDQESYLLGLGLWDRANAHHTTEVKDRTKGQIIRVDTDDKIIARSPELSNIIYQLEPIDEDRIFVGCRTGELCYLNADLSVKKHIDLKTTGLYFWVRKENSLVATLRSGAILFYDLDREMHEIIPVVESDTRMWPIIQDQDRYIVGSYKGHIALIENRRVSRLVHASEKASPVWTIDHIDDHYLVGTALGELLLFDQDLHNKGLVYKNNKGITATLQLNNDQLMFADTQGNIHILNRDGSLIHHIHDVEEKTPNTVWWLTRTDQLVRAAYSNGQMRTFKLE